MHVVMVKYVLKGKINPDFEASGRHVHVLHFNRPLSNYATVSVNNNLKSSLRAKFSLIYLLYFVAPSLDFRLLFAGTEGGPCLLFITDTYTDLSSS